MSFAVVVADTDSGSVRLVSVTVLETEEEAREALASWWTEQPASIRASSRPYVLDLERQAPVLIVPVSETEPSEGSGLLPEDPTRQTREAYEEPLGATVEETVFAEEAIAEAAVTDEDAGAFAADELVPPPPAVTEVAAAEDVVEDGVTDSFLGEADDTESVLEELPVEEPLTGPEPGEDATDGVPEDGARVETVEAEAIVDAAESVEQGFQESPEDAESAEPEPEPAPEVEEPADEMSYYGSTGLAPVAGLAEESEPAEAEADQAVPEEDVTSETVELVAEESAVEDLAVESAWREEAGPDGELIEYAAVEETAAPEAEIAAPAAYEPAPGGSESGVEPDVSWPWELEDDVVATAEPAASDMPAPASLPEVREPLGAQQSQSEAEASRPVMGTATATATEDEPAEMQSETADTAAGAYEPGNLDMDTYTCDDCVYEGTCPKKGEETPATCGSFQWRAS